MTVRVIGYRDPIQPGELVVNTTSRSPDPWSKGLSPFFLGPIPLYGGMHALNMENAWQFSKVYKEYTNPDGSPSAEYFKWAAEGWARKDAVRYPMGKGAKPEYSWWDGEKLTYVEARKRIYVPLYARSVAQTQAFQQLRELYKQHGKITLWDFDGYDHRAMGMSWKDVFDNPLRSAGHAFTLGYLLENLIL